MFLDIRVAAFVVSFAAIAWVVGDAVYQYKHTPGTSILTAFYGSLSILWARFVICVGAVVTFMASVFSYFNLPGVADFIQHRVPIEVWEALPIIIVIVNEMCRRRTLGAQPPATPIGG